jgi:peptide deformylase
LEVDSPVKTEILKHPHELLRTPAPAPGRENFRDGILHAAGTYKPSPTLEEGKRWPKMHWDQCYQEITRGMVRAMVEASGVGIAATQMGLPVRLFLMDILFLHLTPMGIFDIVSHGRTHAAVFRDPKLCSWSKELLPSTEEGCLSLPGVHVVTRRHQKVVLEVEARPDYDQRLMLSLEGEAARVVQHEMDHLEGKLIIDYEEEA